MVALGGGLRSVAVVGGGVVGGGGGVGEIPTCAWWSMEAHEVFQQTFYVVWLCYGETCVETEPTTTVEKRTFLPEYCVCVL